MQVILKYFQKTFRPCQYYPEFTGFCGSIFIQWGIGAIIELWPTTEIGYDPASYQVAIGVLVLMQAAGLGWYLLSQQLIKKQPKMI